MSLLFSALEVCQGDAFLLEKDDWKCLFDSGGHCCPVKVPDDYYKV